MIRRPDANRALGIVLVCDRGAEDGHDRVTDEFLDRSAEVLDVGSKALVVGPDASPHVLGVRAPRTPR